MRVALAAASAFLLSGCFCMCGLSPESAQWEDERMFAAIPAHGHHEGYSAIWTAPGEGLPFERVMDPAWGPHNLTTVARSSVQGHRFDDGTVRMDAERITASRDNTTPEQVVRDDVRAFVANVSALSASEVDAYVEAMLANGTEHAGGGYIQDEQGNLIELRSVSYAAPRPTRLRLEALLASLESVGAAQVSFGGVQAGPWWFGFDVEHRELVADDQGWRLKTDRSGRVDFEGLREGERSEASYKSDVNEILERLGLPQPDDMHVGGSIC